MICGYGQGRYTQAHTYPHTQAHTYPHTQAPTLTFTLTPTQASTQAPTLRRVCNPPPSVAGSATRGKENDATLGGAAFLRHKPFMKGLTRVANPQQKSGGLQTRLNVGENVDETGLTLANTKNHTRYSHVNLHENTHVGSYVNLHETPTLRRVCNPPPTVAGSVTRGREKR